MKHCISACTLEGCNYPAYLSVNEVEAGIEFIVRGERKPDGSCGDTVAMTVSREQFKKIAHELEEYGN